MTTTTEIKTEWLKNYGIEDVDDLMLLAEDLRAAIDLADDCVDAGKFGPREFFLQELLSGWYGCSWALTYDEMNQTWLLTS